MKQSYHANAITNLHIRSQIKESNLTNSHLAQKFAVSSNTISKWKNRNDLHDKSSAPHDIKYALSWIETQVAISVRKSSWLALDEVWEILLEKNTKISRSSVYRVFQRNNINKVPQQEREKAKKFKEYEPGYLHLDVTYLPSFKGQKQYLFVAIDRATRYMHYKVYDRKTSSNTELFFNECLNTFPFEINHVLTDNGLEFTNRLIKSKKGKFCNKPSKLDVICAENNIEHRLTKPATPKTNGMVERVNQTIKKGTILRNKYKNIDEMNNDLNTFLFHYNFYRRHGSLRKELNVKTPLNAIEKWFEIKPELFKENPWQFKQKILTLFEDNKQGFHKQPCET